MFNPLHIPSGSLPSTSSSSRGWRYPKDDEKNFIAATLHLLTITIICSCMTQLEWFRLWGNAKCAPQIGLYHIFSHTYRNIDSETFIEDSAVSIEFASLYKQLPCLSNDVIRLMQVIIFLCFLAVFYSLFGFFLDLFGPKQKLFKILRRNAVPSILCVLTIMCIVAVSYMVTEAMQANAIPEDSSPKHYILQVTYDNGYYLITIAGAFAIVTTACNLLQPQSSMETDLHQRLVEHWDGLETFSVNMNSMPNVHCPTTSSPPHTTITTSQPPPPYSP
ncbi:transmembrane protein 127-like [Diaphorina citri]|uniref:Transmembrane protein 127-like n=2 Tax=Diaphorina citri TaxID=121845 RepID=A0A1S3DAX5_DIACI|nr:transmembrane protein 127-like [Diaphorina citri]KAI5741164.1 hypothetical protein M8J76_010984 [Diaphorina citri]